MSKVFTPRTMRKKFRRLSGGDSNKGQALRKFARVSRLFIHQSASSLEGNHDYQKWCLAVDAMNR